MGRHKWTSDIEGKDNLDRKIAPLMLFRVELQEQRMEAFFFFLDVKKATFLLYPLMYFNLPFMEDGSGSANKWAIESFPFYFSFFYFFCLFCFFRINFFFETCLFFSLSLLSFVSFELDHFKKISDRFDNDSPSWDHWIEQLKEVLWGGENTNCKTDYSSRHHVIQMFKEGNDLSWLLRLWFSLLWLNNGKDGKETKTRLVNEFFRTEMKNSAFFRIF